MTLSNFRNLFNTNLASLYPKTEIDAFFFRLIEHQLQLQIIDVFTKQNIIISKDDLDFMTKVMHKLKTEEPIQYILGSTHFYGLDFEVTPATLIPRPETEELVSWVLTELKEEHFNNLKDIKILDIGTGSGCIAISLKINNPKTEITAIDFSEEAIKVAEKNAKKHNINISFKNIDILKTNNLNENYDVIVSNPPYVRKLEKLEMRNNVLNYEPASALFVSDDNPLIFYNKIANLAAKNLNNNGILFFEINQYLGNEMVNLLNEKGFKEIELKNDLFGKPRMVKAYQNNN